MRIQSLTGAWEFRQAGTEEWRPASVPGGVHTDLLALGHIPDPFVADNEKASNGLLSPIGSPVSFWLFS
jgi:beta-mannosidase